MTSLITTFLVLLTGCILAGSIDYSLIKQLMKDSDRRMPDEPCYTPYDLKDIFSRACEKVKSDEAFCDGAWSAFTSGFGFKDPETVTEEDYKQYFDFVPIISAPNSSLYWSGVPSVVEEISKHRNISSSFNQAASSIVNIMNEQYNVTCWCGNKTAILDTVNPCPPEPLTGFWEAFSIHFADAGKGVVFWIGDGNREGGAYQNTSFFTTEEFPRLTYPRVVRLIAIDIYSCGQEVVEKCGEGTMQLLEDEAIKKYGNTGYKCADVCGDPLDESEVPLLANKTLQIIREEQHIGN